MYYRVSGIEICTSKKTRYIFRSPDNGNFTDINSEEINDSHTVPTRIAVKHGKLHFRYKNKTKENFLKQKQLPIKKEKIPKKESSTLLPVMKLVEQKKTHDDRGY